MDFFKNFLVVIILMGILTRIALYFYLKSLKKEIAIFFAFFTIGFIFLPLISIIIGFDVAFFEYLVALIIWLLFDLLRVNIMKKKEKR